MKFKTITKLSGMLAIILILSSCTQRLVDFTVISSKNIALKMDKTQGKQVTGKSMAVFFIGVNIKDAVDHALESAGPGYDILVDGVIKSKSFYFYGGYVVTGTAINTGKLKASLGEKGFEDWCKNSNIFDPNTAKVQN